MIILVSCCVIWYHGIYDFLCWNMISDRHVCRYLTNRELDVYTWLIFKMAASVAAWSWVLKDWTDQVRASFTSVFVCTASFDADPPKATWESCLHGQRNSTRRSSAAFPEQFTLLLLDILARLWTLKSADWQILHQEMYGQSRSHNHNLLRNLGTWPTRAWRTGFRREIREHVCTRWSRKHATCWFNVHFL